MAGTLQALILNYPVTGSVPFRFRQSQFPTTQFLFSGHRKHSLSLSISRKPIRAADRSYQANGGSNQPPGALGSGNLGWVKPILKFVDVNFLPLVLLGGIALGLANPTLGCLAHSYNISKYSTCSIFIISGLTLRTEEIGAATKAWPVGFLGLGSILFFTPLIAKVILQLQLQPREFITGLALFSSMPTTLSSGIALTRLAGGNSALALAMTVISNLLGILTVPFSVSKLIVAGVGISIPTEQLFRSLVMTILIPLILGKVFRESFKGVADFADHNRKLLSALNAIFLSLVPWMQVSRSSSLLLMVKPAVVLVAVGMGVLLHLILLGFNALILQSVSAVSGGSKSVFAEQENSRAFLLVASQKTLPVAVAIVDQLGGALGESGLVVLPCVAAHLNQIIIDSFLVSYWNKKELR